MKIYETRLERITIKKREIFNDQRENYNFITSFQSHS